MTPTDLQALRRFLFYSAPEAARWLAADEQRPQGVEERTWNRWEAGARPVPDNIAARVASLAAWRGQVVAAGRQAGAQAGRPLVLVVYDDADDWPAHGALRRPHQSAAAQLLAELGPELVRLVPFEVASFRAWQQGRPGLPDEPGADLWAAHQLTSGSGAASWAQLPAVPPPTDLAVRAGGRSPAPSHPPTTEATHEAPAAAGRPAARHP